MCLDTEVHFFFDHVKDMADVLKDLRIWLAKHENLDSAKWVLLLMVEKTIIVVLFIFLIVHSFIYLEKKLCVII